MTTTTRTTKATERQQQIDQLRELVKPGDTVYCILRHVSRSGMMRRISLRVFANGNPDQPRQLDYAYETLMGDRHNMSTEGVRVSGAGMDMGFHMVYNLGAMLWRDGFTCTGEGCPSNDHSNGDRDYTPHHHRDGGYALRARWL